MDKHREKLRESAVEAMMWLLIAFLVWREAWWHARLATAVVAGVHVLLVFGVWYQGRLLRRLEAARNTLRARLGAMEEVDGGPTNADLAAGCDCQRPHGEGVRGVSNDCPLHG